MSMNTENNSSLRIRNIYIIFMFVIGIVGTMDFIMDITPITGYYHHIFHHVLEIGFILFALISGTYMWLSFRKSQGKLSASQEMVGELIQERDKWREKHENAIAGMQEAIKSQLAKWDLSASEMEIALFLMRGYSHKQIAGLLEKSERTVRNQSLNIYKKTGMTGRSELTAFFLEDLFALEEVE